MEEEIVIRDPPFHNHPLYLKEITVREESVDCYVCGNLIANLELIFVCMECDFYNPSVRVVVHIKCGVLPGQFYILGRHHLHLTDFHSSRDDLRCDACRSSLDKLVGYKCCSCEFRFHPTCIDAFLHETKELKHPGHPSHPLTLMRKPAFRLQCDGCGDHDVDMAYMCTTCDFWLHKACALLPATLSTDRHRHHHHLSLAFSFPEKHRKFDYNCDVCGKFFYNSWMYYCDDCRYFAHIRCVGTTAQPNL